MIRLAAPIAVLAALGGVTHWLLRNGWRASRSRKAAAARRRPSESEVRAWITEFGQSANAFMTLYPGFEYFAHPDPAVRGMIAFVETPGAWVGGAEPCCAPERRAEFLAAFAAAAGALGKTALMLPVDAAHAELARGAGFRALMIGTEPTWELDRFPRTGRTWIDVVPTAKTLAAKGAQVTAFDPAALPSEERAALEKMTAIWLDSRKMEGLAFLNQVAPWHRAADKRYFKVEHQGRTLAFLAAIPIWARQSWYLIDLIRRPDSPAGSTELLLLLAMKQLREAGARSCTMGVAPLSGLDQAKNIAAADFAAHRRAYSFLHWIYERGNAFYNFKPLHQYKLKLDPSTGPPVFLIYAPRLGLGGLLGLVRAFQPGGMARAAGMGTLRMLSRFSLADWIRAQLASGTVVRSVPPSWSRLLRRCKLTFALLLANLWIFFETTDSTGRLLPSIEGAWGFSWFNLAAHPGRALLLSPFLHWNTLHLCLNIVTLVLFTGGLEYLAGTGIAAACYLLPMLLANPATAAALAFFRTWVPTIDPLEIDVGASLGIFGCAGGLSHFLRWGPGLLGCLALAAILSAISSHAYLPLNHVAALAIGWLVGRALLRT